jgi:hypothetical protein
MVDWSERSRAGCRCVIQCVSTFDERGGSYQDNWLCKTKLLDAPIILRVKYNDYPKRATRLNAAILRRRAVNFFFFLPLFYIALWTIHTYSNRSIKTSRAHEIQATRKFQLDRLSIVTYIINSKNTSYCFDLDTKFGLFFLKPLWTKLRL